MLRKNLSAEPRRRSAGVMRRPAGVVRRRTAGAVKRRIAGVVTRRLLLHVKLLKRRSAGGASARPKTLGTGKERRRPGAEKRRNDAEQRSWLPGTPRRRPRVALHRRTGRLRGSAPLSGTALGRNNKVRRGLLGRHAQQRSVRAKAEEIPDGVPLLMRQRATATRARVRRLGTFPRPREATLTTAVWLVQEMRETPVPRLLEVLQQQGAANPPSRGRAPRPLGLLRTRATSSRPRRGEGKVPGVGALPGLSPQKHAGRRQTCMPSKVARSHRLAGAPGLLWPRAIPEWEKAPGLHRASPTQCRPEARWGAGCRVARRRFLGRKATQWPLPPATWSSRQTVIMSCLSRLTTRCGRHQGAPLQGCLSSER